MAALDFPSSPTLGQQFTSGLQTWEWDTISWNIVPTVVGGGEASIAVGPDAPVGPDDGDLWWDTDDPALQAGLVDPTALANNSAFITALSANATYNAVLNNRYNPVVLNVHSLSTPFSTTGTHTTYQDEGLTLTLTPPGTRRWRFTLIVNPYTPGGIQEVVYSLMAGVTLLRNWYVGGMSTTSAHGMVLQHTQILGALGSTIFKIQVKAANANTSITSYADAGQPRQLIIEDIGIL